MFHKYSNFTPKDNKKYFKSLRGKEKLTTAINIVNMFLNTKIFTQEITSKTPHIISAAEYILERQSKNKISNIELAKTFNNVLTKINNNSKSLEKISKILNYKISDENDMICIGPYYVKSIKANKLYSLNPKDFFWIFDNNQIYMVLPKDETLNNDLEIVICNNLYNTNSVKVPLVLKENINTSVLNGKDWVKSYILSEERGFLYFIKAKIKNQIFYKVGITKSKDRFKYKDIEILESNFIEMKMLKAAIVEQYIHITNNNRRLFINHIDNTFEGKNECYHIDLYDFYKNIDITTCIKEVADYKKYNYNILSYAMN